VSPFSGICRRPTSAEYAPPAITREQHVPYQFVHFADLGQRVVDVPAERPALLVRPGVLREGRRIRSRREREATLAGKEKTLQQDERAVKALEGQLQASSISEDGVYVVGSDIKSGTWHTSGDGGQGDDACYYATLSSTNTSDIDDNNNFDGPGTVELTGVYAFQISGPCTWYRTGS
jgi:hypothetical protein